MEATASWSKCSACANALAGFYSKDHDVKRFPLHKSAAKQTLPVFSELLEGIVGLWRDRTYSSRSPILGALLFNCQPPEPGTAPHASNGTCSSEPTFPPALLAMSSSTIVFSQHWLAESAAGLYLFSKCLTSSLCSWLIRPVMWRLCIYQSLPTCASTYNPVWPHGKHWEPWLCSNKRSGSASVRQGEGQQPGHAQCPRGHLWLCTRLHAAMPKESRKMNSWGAERLKALLLTVLRRAEETVRRMAEEDLRDGWMPGQHSSVLDWARLARQVLKPRLVHLIASHISGRNMPPMHLTLSFCTWWCKACCRWGWKPIPWRSLHTVVQLNWRPLEVWRALLALQKGGNFDTHFTYTVTIVSSCFQFYIYIIHLHYKWAWTISSKRKFISGHIALVKIRGIELHLEMLNIFTGAVSSWKQWNGLFFYSM